MPQRHSGALNDPSSMERVLRSQRMLQEALATGRVPVEQEIKARLSMARLLLRSYDYLKHQRLVDLAIQHLETILRRASPDSPEYPEYLTKLLQARLSEYLATSSEQALHLAIQVGHKALDSSIAVDLSTKQPDDYRIILSDLAHARSHRHLTSNDPDDLDIAIACTMELSELVPRASEPHRFTLNNLSSQMRRRYVHIQDPEDLEAAARLTRELLNMPTTEPLHYALAQGQLASISYDKFKQTESAVDLDSAIEHGEHCLRILPGEHEMLFIVLLMLVHAYDARYEARGTLSDLAELVRHGEQLSSTMSTTHSDWSSLLEHHLLRTEQYISQDPSLDLLGRILPGLRK